MSKYTITIEGDFGRFECYKCPCFLEIELCCDERAVRCAFGGNYEECPLEEVGVAENAISDKDIERLIERMKKEKVIGVTNESDVEVVRADWIPVSERMPELNTVVLLNIL